jgi:hypothetical protein
LITRTISGQIAPQHGELTCVQHAAIDSVDAEWDRFVSRDVPHLRSGFLRAVERSGIIHEPAYLMVYLDGQPAAAALGYTLAIDAHPPN